MTVPKDSSPDNALTKLAKRVLPAPVKLAARARWKQGRIALNLPDRVFLEETVIPWFRERESINRVLDIGTDWYTWRYERLFPNQEYHSIDFDPAKAKFAGKRHVTGSILELDRHFSENQFDLIICNGVFGWGVNEPEQIREAVSQLSRCLSPKGYLVVGWNDNDERRPEGIEKELQKALSPFVLPPVGSEFYDTETAHRHLFRFYQVD